MFQSSFQTVNKAVSSRYRTLLYNSRDKTLGYLLICFILWPFGTFLYSLYNYTHKESRIIFVLFTAVFGYSMIADSDELDLFRYLEKITEYIQLSSGEFFKMISGTYSGATNRDAGDLYVDIVAFLVSRFSSSGSVLMMVFGLVFGYVYSKSLALLLSFNQLQNRYTIILLICFSFIIGLEQLAGVRYGTAAYLFFTGSIKLIQNRGSINWLYILSAVFVHFGFIPGALLILIFPIIGKKEWIIYGITILSFIVPNIFHSFFMQFSSLFEGGLSKKVNTYANVVVNDNTENTLAQAVWFVKYRFIIILNYSYIALAFCIYKTARLRTTLYSKKLLLLTLLLLTLSNFTILIPEFSFRYKLVYLMFFMGYLYKIYSLNKNSITMQYIAYGALAASMLQIIYVLRCFLYYTPASLFYGNIVQIFINDDIRTVWSLIKGF